MIKVFISYAKEDIEAAREVYERLQATANIEPWLDEKCMLPGDIWREAIREAIQESRFFVVLLSKNAITKKGFFQKEVSIALEIFEEFPENQIFLIPIRLDDSDPPKKLEQFHYVDFSKAETIEKVLNVIKQTPKDIGRIERAKRIIEVTKHVAEECKKSEKQLTLRMRATFTSMTNIAHYTNEEIPGLLSQERTEIDALLVEERNYITCLLDLENVRLKCICWPKLRFLKYPYYTEQQKRKRVELLRSFLNDSLEHHIDRRRVLCDKAGAYGNQLIFGHDIAIVANPRSGGYYTETSIFNDQQVVDVLTKEYDVLFNRIFEEKGIKQVRTKEDHKAMLYLVINMLSQEIEEWEGSPSKELF